MHDPARFGVNQARVYTVPNPVVHQVARFENAPNLPESGRNSGWRLKLVNFENMGSWCEPLAVPCEQPSRERSPTPQIEQHSQVALAGSIPKEAKKSILDTWVAGANQLQFRVNNPPANAVLPLEMGNSPRSPRRTPHPVAYSSICPESIN